MKAHCNSVAIFFKFNIFVIPCFLVLFTNLILNLAFIIFNILNENALGLNCHSPPF